MITKQTLTTCTHHHSCWKRCLCSCVG